jgi:aldehyde:ferredoxin oxidoreductase
LRKIAYREGVGETFAQGVRKAAEKIGQGSEKFAIHVKGLELPGVEPRGSCGMALAFATADRGGCHQRAWTPTAELKGILPRFSTEGVARFVKETQDERARKEDTLPPRIMDEPSPAGPAKGKVITSKILNKMLDEYYALRGWDQNGIPTEETLKRLGLK